MDCSISRLSLLNYINNLLERQFPDGSKDIKIEKKTLTNTLEKIELCHSQINKKYYKNSNGKPIFNHLNADHMAAFLWFLSDTVFQENGSENLCVRLSYLNKIMHGLDLFYTVRMPEVFLLVHPVGSVIGRASYKNFLAVYQNCTVGSKGENYPVFGEGVVLYSSSSVIGSCCLGDNVILGSGSLLVDESVPNQSIVLGRYPQHKIKPAQVDVKRDFFEV